MMPPRAPAACVPALLLLVAALVVPAARGQPIVENVAPVPGPAGPAFVDSAGRRVDLPPVIRRVMPADRDALVLVEVLAPATLAGGLQAAPHPTPAGMAAAARRAGADLIIDAGPVTPERAAFADAVQRLSGITYILVDNSFDRMPRMMRTIGTLLGVAARADDLGLYADHAISGLRGRLLITPVDTRPRVYFALGPDGLTTALPGSPAAAVLAEAGVINVASPLGRDTEARITPAQLIGFNPDTIIAERRSAYERLRHDPALRGLDAVRRGRVYLEPTHPFGWIEHPSGINRLIGLHWLSTLFYPAATEEDIRTAVCDFYNRFYRVKLTNAQIEAMVRPAGIPPAENGRNPPEPLIGLGAAPPSSLAPARPGPGATGANVSAPSPAGASPSALTGVPGLPNTAPNAACTVPAGPMPLPLPGLASTPGVPAAPAVPRGSPNP